MLDAVYLIDKKIPLELHSELGIYESEKYWLD